MVVVGVVGGLWLGCVELEGSGVLLFCVWPSGFGVAEQSAMFVFPEQQWLPGLPEKGNNKRDASPAAWS